MALQPQQPTWRNWQGWSTISADSSSAFTLWCTGLSGSGKTTVAQLVQKALQIRGYKVEIIDNYTLGHWLQNELHLGEQVSNDDSDKPGYDAFITYICSLLARNGIVTITTSVSPYTSARAFAREHLHPFIEIYLHCLTSQRQRRIRQREQIAPHIAEDFYEVPVTPEISLDTAKELPERSALRILHYLEEQGYIAPRWEINDINAGAELIKARLHTLEHLQ